MLDLPTVDSGANTGSDSGAASQRDASPLDGGPSNLDGGATAPDSGAVQRDAAADTGTPDPVTGVCKAGSTFCGLDPDAPSPWPGTLLCNEDGSGAEFIAPCLGATCVESGTTATCEPWVCTPDAWECTDDYRSARHCSADGFSVVETVSCAPSQVCSGGHCRECEPSAYFCSEDKRKLLLCSPSGDTWSEMSDCFALGKFCRDGSLYLCSPRLCPPLGVGCDANWRANCDEVGAGFTSPIEDCGAGGLVCYQGACGPDAVDEVANFEPDLSSIGTYGGLVGNDIEVTLSRTLTEIEMRFRTNRSVEFHWIVYEYETGGPANVVLLHEVTGPPQGEYYSSGPIDVALTAGKTYFIGAAVYDQYVSELYVERRVPEALTFGEALGHFRDTSLTTPRVIPTNTLYLFTQRLHTSPGP